MPGGGFPLSELRAAVLSSADWAPTQSTSFITELDRFIWQAARRLTTLVPSLLYSTERMWVHPEYRNNAVASDRLRVVTGDALVLERLTTSASRTAWNFTGLWGSWNLWVTDSSNVVHRYRAREFWQDLESGTERVSLDKPFFDTTATGMTWRLFQDPWAMPPDVVSIADVRVFNAGLGGGYQNLRGVTERELDDAQRASSVRTGGDPYYWCKGPPWPLQPPRHTPAVTNAGTWEAGGDDTGVWEYCRTLAWGIRDPDCVDPHGNFDPTWESAPSPVSSQATSVAGAGGAITVSWPSPDYIAHYTGLPSSGSVRNGRSGLYTILYARRVSDTETPPVNELGGFYRLAVLSVAPGSYVHDGSAQLVYERPLIAQHVCRTFRIWPLPSRRTELDLRVVKAPMPLTVAADVLPIPSEVVDIVILDARRRLAEKMKELGVATDIEKNQIPRAVAAALGAYETDTSRTLIRGECDDIVSNPRGYDIDQLESLLYGLRS